MIRALALILSLISGSAHATVDGWPALYDVVGVAEDDVLNIRSGPGAGFEIIGTLPHDAEGIEVVHPSEDLDWGRINHGDGAGWISLLYAVPQPGQWYGQMPDIRQCFGTEPFWSLTLGHPSLSFATPDAEPIDGLVSGLFASHSRRDRFMQKAVLLSPETGPLDVVLSLRTIACSDGMSDRAYGIDLDLLITDPSTEDGLFRPVLLSGCCSLQPPAESD